jgi:hypothetical protein
MSLKSSRAVTAAALLAAAVTFLCPSPAAAQFPLGGLFGSQSTQPDQKNTSDPRARMTQGSDQQQETGGAAALLEDIANAPGAGFEPFDYLDAGATIQLGQRGTATISYFEGCRVEKIRGGTVTIGAKQSTVSGGQVNASTMACKGAKPIVVASAREAGAAVNRITPFPADRWAEWTVKSDRPVFSWRREPDENAQTMYRVTIVALDSSPPQIVWSADAKNHYLPYAPGAPRLAAGMPYQVRVEVAGKTAAEAVFSVDPALDIADTPANRVVPVRR